LRCSEAKHRSVSFLFSLESVFIFAVYLHFLAMASLSSMMRVLLAGFLASSCLISGANATGTHHGKAMRVVAEEGLSIAFGHVKVAKPGAALKRKGENNQRVLHNRTWPDPICSCPAYTGTRVRACEGRPRLPGDLYCRPYPQGPPSAHPRGARPHLSPLDTAVTA
jgi:hypothetical protein